MFHYAWSKSGPADNLSSNHGINLFSEAPVNQQMGGESRTTINQYLQHPTKTIHSRIEKRFGKEEPSSTRTLLITAFIHTTINLMCMLPQSNDTLIQHFKIESTQI